MSSIRYRVYHIHIVKFDFNIYQLDQCTGKAVFSHSKDSNVY